MYFYDEELVDVDEEDENGNCADSHKRRKSFRNKLKRQRATEQLAKYRNKMEYTTGDPVIRTHMLTGDNEKG